MKPILAYALPTLCLSVLAGLPGTPTQVAQLQRVQLLTPQQQAVLSHMSIVYLDDGQGGQTETIRFTGVDVQIVNGLNDTTTNNGHGNLLLGYAEPPSGAFDRTGSHNLVLGTENSYASHSNLLVARECSVPAGAPYCFVNGYRCNVGNDFNAVVAGLNCNVDGQFNAILASIGCNVTGVGASGAVAIGSTDCNVLSRYSGAYSSVNTSIDIGGFGGAAALNAHSSSILASTSRATLIGCNSSTVSGTGNGAMVIGGWNNAASGQDNLVIGGNQNSASALDNAIIVGGVYNTLSQNVKVSIAGTVYADI